MLHYGLINLDQFKLLIRMPGVNPGVIKSRQNVVTNQHFNESKLVNPRWSISGFSL